MYDDKEVIIDAAKPSDFFKDWGGLEEGLRGRQVIIRCKAHQIIIIIIIIKYKFRPGARMSGR